MIHNQRGVDIDHLSASPAGNNTFGQDLMDGVADGALDAGKSYSVDGLS